MRTNFCPLQYSQKAESTSWCIYRVWQHQHMTGGINFCWRRVNDSTFLLRKAKLTICFLLSVKFLYFQYRNNFKCLSSILIRRIILYSLEFQRSCRQSFLYPPSRHVTTVNSQFPWDCCVLNFSDEPCVYRTQRGRNATGPSPQLTTEEPWDSCSCMISQARSRSALFRTGG